MKTQCLRRRGHYLLIRLTVVLGIREDADFLPCLRLVVRSRTVMAIPRIEHDVARVEGLEAPDTAIATTVVCVTYRPACGRDGMRPVLGIQGHEPGRPDSSVSL